MIIKFLVLILIVAHQSKQRIILNKEFLFEWYPSLDLYTATSISLTSRNIALIDQDTFANFVNLKVLRLDSNQIESIQPILFSDLKLLTKLNLNSNEIKQSLDPNIFDSLKNLETLDLSKNSLTFISPSTFLQLTKLKELKLCCNLIETLHRDLFMNLTSLKHLDFIFKFLNLFSNFIFKIKQFSFLIFFIIHSKIMQHNLI